MIHRLPNLLAITCFVYLHSRVEVAAQAPAAPTGEGRITGRVLDGLGDPVTAARVRFEFEADGTPEVLRTLADADGMFVFGKVPFDDERVLRVIAVSKGRCSGSDFARVTRLRPETWSTLRLWDAGSMDLVIVDGADEPIAGVAVIAAAHKSRIFGFEPNGRGVTDAEGRLHLDGIPLGGVDVRAWSPGFEPALMTVWLSDRATQRITLTRGGGVSLKVHVDGLPEGKEAKVRVLPYGFGGYQALPGLDARCTTVAGAFERDSLPDLEYRISAQLDGFVSRPREHRLEAGKAPHDVRFAFEPIGSVRLKGKLEDSAGKALAGETVQCRPSNTRAGASAITDADGHFEVLSTLAIGEKAIFELLGEQLTLVQEKSEEHSGNWDARFMGKFEFVIDPAIEYALVAIPAVTIRGKVVDPEGHPARGRTVELQEAKTGRMPVWMPVRSTTTDGEGRFSMSGAYPLPVPMRVALGRQDSAASEIFEAKSGATIGGLVIVAVPMGVIEGTILDEDGRPRVGARVWLRNWSTETGRQIDGSVTEILSDRQGRYRFLDVEPGGHRLELFTTERNAIEATGTFEVESGSRVTVDFGKR